MHTQMLFDDYLANECWRDVRRLTDGPSAFSVDYFEPGKEVTPFQISLRSL